MKALDERQPMEEKEVKSGLPLNSRILSDSEPVFAGLLSLKFDPRNGPQAVRQLGGTKMGFCRMRKNRPLKVPKPPFIMARRGRAVGCHAASFALSPRLISLASPDLSRLA